jgi:type I restriction enzyme S subunit
MTDNNSHIASSLKFPLSDWVETTLGEVCEKITDGTHSTVVDKEDGDYFLLSCKNIKDGNIYISEKERKIDNETLNFLRKRTKLQKNDVLLTSVGTIGEVAYIKEENPKYEFQRSVAILKPNIKEINHLFLFYYLKSKHKHLNLSAEGAVQKCLFIGRIKEFPISLPPLPEQQAITSVLSAFDDKIELLREENKTLEEIGKTIYKEWFGKYSVEKPEELPEGWRVGKIEDIFDFLEGPGIRNWQYTENGTRFINIRLIQNGDILVENSNFVSDEEANGKYKHFMLQERDFVLSTSGTLGRGAIVRKEHLPLMLNTSVIRFRPKDEISYGFMYLFLQSSFFIHELESLASGSVQLNFGPMHLRQIEMIMPNEEILKNFANTVNPIFEKIADNFSQIQSLARSRDEILPKLMSGQVRASGFNRS